LHRLTGLEQEKLRSEYGDILKTIADLPRHSRNPERLMKVIRDELIAIREQYGDKRRTEIVQSRVSLSMEDLIADEDVVVTACRTPVTSSPQPLAAYRAQRRGGARQDRDQHEGRGFRR